MEKKKICERCKQELPIESTIGLCDKCMFDREFKKKIPMEYKNRGKNDCACHKKWEDCFYVTQYVVKCLHWDEEYSLCHVCLDEIEDGSLSQECQRHRKWLMDLHEKLRDK